MNKTLIAGAKICDASGAAPFEGDVLVEGNRVRAVSRTPGKSPRPVAKSSRARA